MFQLPPPIAEMTVSKELLAQEAAKADVAIITIGRNAGEGADRKLENDFYLSGAEKELLQNTATAFHAKNKKIIIILNIGGVIEVASWRQWADAILLAWQPGQEAGNAIADIIFGKVNPSGKLATTFPIDYKDVPSAKNFPGKELVDTSKIRPAGMRGKPSEVVYEEGIYVGYRYYQTFQVKPAYEFGYGRSYTQFAYGPLKLSSTQFKGSVDVSVIVTNTGKVPGKEVVELYLHAPAGKMDKPEMELKAFGKTALLQPGKTQSLRFRLSAQDLASFDTKSSSWIAESGKYQVMAGSSSLQISQKAFFELKKDLVTEKDSPKLVPKQPIQELSRPASSASIVELNNFVITTR